MDRSNSLSRRNALSWTGCSIAASLSGCTSYFSGDSITINWEVDVENSRHSFAVNDGIAYIGTTSGLVTVDTETGKIKGRNEPFNGGDIYGQPAIDSGVAYYGSVNGNTIYAVTRDGTELWRTEVAGSIISCSTGNGLVYAATGVNGRHGLYALDNESGDVMWDIDLSDFPITSSPVFHEGRVLLQSGGISSFNAETGGLQWRYEVTNGSPIHAPTTIPAIDNSLIYCSFDEEPGLLVVDLETGNPVWETNSVSFASPAAQNGIVYAGSVEGESPMYDSEPDTKFFSYDIKKGDELWNAEIGQSASFGPDLESDLIYTTAGISHETLYILDAETGDIIWEYEFDQSISQPIVEGNQIYLLSENNHDESLLEVEKPVSH